MTIKLFWKYLKANINQLTYRLGEARISDPVQKALAQTDEEPFDVTFCLREIEGALAFCKVLLKERILNITGDATDALDKYDAETYDDTTFNPEWEVKFGNGYEYDGKAIAELLHRFVVLYVVKSWASMHLPEQLASIVSDMGEVTAELKSAMIAEPIKVRKPHPEEFEEVIYNGTWSED